jgi:hypothetical protein
MVTYNKKTFSAKAIADALNLGIDVLIWENSWERISSASSFSCVVDFDGTRIYPKAKLSWLQYSQLSRSATYTEVKRFLNNLFSAYPEIECY